MADERTVFLMEQQSGSVRIAATGPVTHDMLDAIHSFLHRARKRLDMGLVAAPSICECPPHIETRKSEGESRYWIECEKCGAVLRELPIPNNA